MFSNLKAEMDRHGITKDDIARVTGKDPLWVEKALQEKTFLPVEIAITVKKTFFPSVTYEYLFGRKN